MYKEHGWMYRANRVLNIISSAVGSHVGILCDPASLHCMWYATSSGLQAQLSLWARFWPQSWWTKISVPKPGITTLRLFLSSALTTHSDHFYSCQWDLMRGWLGRKDTAACHPLWTKGSHSHTKAGNQWLNLSPH